MKRFQARRDEKKVQDTSVKLTEPKEIGQCKVNKVSANWYLATQLYIEERCASFKSV